MSNEKWMKNGSHSHIKRQTIFWLMKTKMVKDQLLLTGPDYQKTECVENKEAKYI